MRLTALWLRGTLLALTSLSWTATDSGAGDTLGDETLGPCAATLRRQETCREARDEQPCPYLFSLPPLTVHLPKQLRELEEIMKDLQTLKDSVDELRKMCADCTVSQSGRECGGQREKLNEDTVRHEDGNKWMDERDPGERDNCETDRAKGERTVERDGGNRIILDEEERKQRGSEKQGDKSAMRESEKEDLLKEKTGKDVRNQTEGAKAPDKPRQGKVPTSGGKDRTVEMPRENNNRDEEEDSNKEPNAKMGSKGEPEDKLDDRRGKKTTINVKNTNKTPEGNYDVRQEETEKVPKSLRKENRGHDGIKMSEEHDAHTNKEQKQHSGENKGESRIKAELNNEKPKQSENTGSTKEERTIKEGEAEEVDSGIKREGEKRVQGEQRDADGVSASSEATPRADFVSISPAPRSAIGSGASYDSLDPSGATAATSSLPPPHSPSPASHSIADANRQTITAAYEPPTRSTGAAGADERPERPPTADAVNTLDEPSDAIKGPVNPAPTKTTSSRFIGSYTTAAPAVMGRSSNTKVGLKPLPGRAPTPDKRHKPAVKTKTDQGPKNTQTHQKPDGARVPDTKPVQKQKPSHQQPTTGLKPKPKPGKDPKTIYISKPDQRPLLDNSTTDRNLTKTPIRKPGQAGTFNKNRFPDAKPDSDLKPVPPVRSLTPSVNVAATPEKDPSTDRQPESDQIAFTNHSSTPGKKLHHPPETNKPDQNQTPGRKALGDEKSQPDHRDEQKQSLPNVGESESERRETTQLTTESEPNQNEKPSSVPESKPTSLPGQKLRPALTITSPDQTPPTGQKIPMNNQKPKPGRTPTFNQKHPGPVTNQRPKPKPGNPPQTDPGIKTPPSDRSPKTVPGEVPEAESSKPVRPRPPPRPRPPTTPDLKPGATRLQRPKPAVRPKPSPKTKGESPSSVTAPNIHRTAHTDPSHTSGQHTDGVTHYSQNPELTRRVTRTTTVAPKDFITEDTRAPAGSHPAAESLPVSPNSRTPSDTRPPAAAQPPPMPATTSPEHVVSGTSPRSTKRNLSPNADSSSQPTIPHNAEASPEPDDALSPVLLPSSHTTPTVNPDLASATSGRSGPRLPDAEASTPSARELRVKINQVAALLNGSLSQYERPLDRGPKKPLEDERGGRRPDGGPPLTSPQAPASMRDCSDHLLQGARRSGVYLVTPDPSGTSFRVLCDMELAGGGWTLVQRRHDGSVSFNRTWAEYRSGFGDLGGGEFWLGNHPIHLLTRDRDTVLRVELRDFDGLSKFAQYEQFRVASERLRYRLTVGGYSGTAGDALRFSRTYDHNHRAFTTPDKDHDRYPSGNCGAYYSSGWWFDACMAANLNGRYYVKRYKGIRDGIFWGTWHNMSTEYYPTNYRQSFKSVRMMIRPKGFAP
ncbi:mucin-2-like [Betta splendens]|uniref:Mucin-2-like n=1 Tax=Betta splendens TaxID=158456 RepID=A0A6P7MWN8_BETSP|nr:mucin-2-like [Betta splendens]